MDSVLVHQSKSCAQMYLPKNCMLHKFAIINTIVCKIDYFKHALSYNVGLHVYQFLAKSVSRLVKRAHKYFCKKLEVTQICNHQYFFLN